MTRLRLLIGLTVCLLTVSISTLTAQESEITRADFLGLMKRSDDVTKASPHRIKATVETGMTLAGPWEPYSSMVEERVLPDRSYTVYTSRLRGETLRVGKVNYRKQRDGSWVRHPEEAQGWLVTPSSEPMFAGPVVEYWRITHNESTEGKGTAVKVVSKPKVESPELATGTLTYVYYFDDKGVLYKHLSTAFNGKNWVKTTSVYEYDPKIKIEAPIE